MADLVADVVDAARYLRSIRPVDPAEVTDYTTVDTTPAAVAEILRSHALALDLVECEHGTFAPPPDEPLGSTAGPVEALPPALDDALDEWLTRRRGRGWAAGDAGESLRASVRSLKARYLEGGQLAYDADDADAYLLYHFPRSFAATQYVLDELIERDLLGHSLRILDVGAGVGAHLAAIDAATPDDALLEYVAIEPSPLGEYLEATAAHVGVNTHVTTHRVPFEAVDLDPGFDVVLLGNVLSEVPNPEAFASRALTHVAADGSLVALAPADPRTSVEVRRVERSLEADAGVFSPTIRLWPDRSPSDDCWSFVEQPPLATPSVQRSLAAAADEPSAYRNTSVRYSYAIVRPDGRRRYPVDPSAFQVRPLAALTEAIGDRVDVVAVKLSGDLATSGNPVYRLGDGSQTEPVFAVSVAPSTLSAALDAAPYGAVLTLSNALALWNDEEAAINLVVDDETIVEQVAPRT